MIDLLEKKLLTATDKDIIDLGAGYIEDAHYNIAKGNRLTLLDIAPIVCSNADAVLPFDIIQADACATDIRSGSFDVAASSMLVQHVDAEAHFSEVRRILREGGIYWFACTGERHNRELDHPNRYWLNVAADQFSKYGAKLIEEEEYCVLYDAKDLKRYEQSITGSIANASCRLDPFQLTKHFCLFEIQN